MKLCTECAGNAFDASGSFEVGPCEGCANTSALCQEVEQIVSTGTDIDRFTDSIRFLIKQADNEITVRHLKQVTELPDKMYSAYSSLLLFLVNSYTLFAVPRDIARASGLCQEYAIRLGQLLYDKGLISKTGEILEDTISDLCKPFNKSDEGT